MVTIGRGKTKYNYTKFHKEFYSCFTKDSMPLNKIVPIYRKFLPSQRAQRVSTKETFVMDELKIVNDAC
jgi:hypothetical protein